MERPTPDARWVCHLHAALTTCSADAPHNGCRDLNLTDDQRAEAEWFGFPLDARPAQSVRGDVPGIEELAAGPEVARLRQGLDAYDRAAADPSFRGPYTDFLNMVKGGGRAVIAAIDAVLAAPPATSGDEKVSVSLAALEQLMDARYTLRFVDDEAAVTELVRAIEAVCWPLGIRDVPTDPAFYEADPFGGPPTPRFDPHLPPATSPEPDGEARVCEFCESGLRRCPTPAPLLPAGAPFDDPRHARPAPEAPATPLSIADSDDASPWAAPATADRTER